MTKTKKLIKYDIEDHEKTKSPDNEDEFTQLDDDAFKLIYKSMDAIRHQLAAIDYQCIRLQLKHGKKEIKYLD